MYETNRENFDKIIKAYKEYVKLYKAINNGSTEGVSDFSAFFFRYTQFSVYEDPTRAALMG